MHCAVRYAAPHKDGKIGVHNLQNSQIIEYEPAILVAQFLVVKHEFSDFAGKLCALPLTLYATSLYTTFSFRSRRACSPDCVSRCAQFVSCHMSHRSGLSGGVSRISCRAAQLSGSAHRVTSGGTRLSHRDFTSYPGVYLLNRPARTVVAGLHLLEEMQYVLRAISRPNRKEAMIGIL